MKRRSLIKIAGFFAINTFIKKSDADIAPNHKPHNSPYYLPISYLIDILCQPMKSTLSIYVGKQNLDPSKKANQIKIYNSALSISHEQPLKIKVDNSNIEKYFVEPGVISLSIFNDKNEMLFNAKTINLKKVIEKKIKECESLSELRVTIPTIPEQNIYVKAHHVDSTYGGGYFQYDISDNETPDNDGTVVVTESGERWIRKIETSNSELKAVWFGARPELNYDSSMALQNAIDEAERIVKKKKAKRISIKLPPLINTQQSIYLNPAYSFLEPEAGITEWRVENSQTSFRDNYAIHITGNLDHRGNEGDVPYVNNTIYILSHILIYEYSNTNEYNKINCIKHYATLEGKRGISEIVSQLGIQKCRFTGFSDVYSNSDNGWGICFWECGFDKYNRAIVLSSGINNSERITFRECVLQNGQLAFDIYGWTGGLLIDNCSINYNANGEIINRGGFVTVRGGHIENKNRKTPICINMDTLNAVGKAKFQDVTFVNFGINGNKVYLFTSTRKQNLIIEDSRFSWAENENSGEIASRNTKITDSIGCIFIRNWQMSGEEGRHPLVTEGLLQSPHPIHLKRTILGNLSTNIDSQNGNILCISKVVLSSETMHQEHEDKIVINCPIINTYQHRFLTWIIKTSYCKLKSPVIIKVFAVDENNLLIKQLGSRVNMTNDTAVINPTKCEHYINNNYSSIAIEFDMSNNDNGDKFSILAIGAISYS